MAGSFNSPGLNALTDGIAKAYVASTGEAVTYALVAADSISATTIRATAVVAFDAAASGSADISSNVTLTIPNTLATPFTITAVHLIKTGGTIGEALATYTISSDNIFENGGDLIVTSYEISVAN